MKERRRLAAAARVVCVCMCVAGLCVGAFMQRRYGSSMRPCCVAKQQHIMQLVNSQIYTSKRVQ